LASRVSRSEIISSNFQNFCYGGRTPLEIECPKTALPVDVIINRVLNAIVACGAMGDLERSSVGGRSFRRRLLGETSSN